jgi:hypothetical protein
MTPRCFLLATGAIGPRGAGGEIFSNVKAGMVYPLFVELKHSLGLPNILGRTAVRLARLEVLKHGLCQIVAMSARIANRCSEL